MKRIISTILAIAMLLSCMPVWAAETITLQCEDMTFSGSYAGKITSPFSGGGFYGNNDAATGSITFPYGNAYYTLSVRGASSKASSAAGISVYIDGVKKAAMTFSSTTASTSTVDITVYEAKTGTIKLLMETDNGSNDTYIDYIKLTHNGNIPDAPVLPEKGAVETGNYRNLFAEMGVSQEEVDQKLEAAFQQLFYGADGEDIIEDGKRVYYPVDDDMAYILDTGNNDVRSEGMSYGMMIAVQLDKQEEFNRLWKWAKTYMYHSSGERKGYFAWQCSTSGSKKDNNTASDGEEYFAAALLFASARWGDGEGIYNYRQEALTLLSYMLYTNDRPGYELKTIIDPDLKMVVFTPYGSAANYTDPSYHLPAFYEVFAREAPDKTTWLEVAENSRQFFKSCTHPTTGLAPDYATFEGEGYGSKDYYSYDAWRVPMNIAMDYSWWKADEWQNEYANRNQAFFHSEGMGSYLDNYELDGTPKYNADHSIGAVSCNAVASLAADTSVSWEFVNELWNVSIPEGKWRYYNGMLYLLGLLNVSGNYKCYLSENATLEMPETPENGGEAVLPDGEWIEVLNHKTDLESYKDLYAKNSSNSGVSYNKYGPSQTPSMQITGGGSSNSAGIKIDISDLVSDSEYIKTEFNIQVTGAVDSIKASLTDDVTTSYMTYAGEEEFKTGVWIDYVTNPIKVISENGKVYFCVTNSSGLWYISNLVIYKLKPDPDITFAGINKNNIEGELSGTVTLSNTYDTSKPVYMIVACYRDNALSQVSITTPILGVGGTSIPYSITDDGYESVKLMFWQSMTQLSPLFYYIDLI